MIGSLPNVSRMRMRERDLHSKFELDWPIIAEVIPFVNFWLVGRLVGPVCLHGFF